MNWDYVAGFFDGEGYVHVVNSKPRINCRASIGQVKPQVLYDIQKFLTNQKIRSHIYANYRGTYRLYVLDVCDRRSVKRFFEAIKDKLIVKRDVVANLLRRHNWSMKWTRYTEDEIKTIMELRKKGLTIDAIAKETRRGSSGVFDVFSRLEKCSSFIEKERS